MEDRFVDVETKVAYLERNLEALDEVVTSQQKEIDMLKMQMEAMIQHLQTGNGPQMDVKDEPLPPHY